MGAPPGKKCRPENGHPVSQGRVPWSDRDFEICTLVPRTVRLKPDLTLDFQGLLRSAWISRSASGKLVFGLSDSREGTRLCYDRRALVQPGQHSVDRYLALARLAGADTSGPIQFPLPCGKTIRSLKLPERFVVLHPFARGASKSLTPEEIFEFTRLLVPVPVVVVGRSRVHFKTDRKCLSLVNQTDLAELIWLLRQSSFTVSVDSGPMHIAAAITPEVLSIHTWSDPGAVGTVQSGGLDMEGQTDLSGPVEPKR